MRSDLVKLEGVSHIETDLRTQRCKFRLANKTLDLTAALDEFAKTNEHIKGWKLVSRVEPQLPATPPNSDSDSNGNQPNTDEEAGLLK
ncbi:MAG: hypothetical protein HZA46_04740 [Planctomycetales bacterium]|nr:hypothetical protein [Planctomycetales bacterium]